MAEQIKDFFADLTGRIEDAQLRQTILDQAEKNPKVKEIVARVNSLATDGENYREWHKTQWPTFKNAAAERDAAQNELKNANETIARLQANGGGNGNSNGSGKDEFSLDGMTREGFASLMEEEIRKQGFLSRGEVDTMLREQTAAITTRIYGHALPLLEDKLACKRQFEKDFPGQKFEDEKFVEFLGANQFPSMQKAFESFTASLYTQKREDEAFERGRTEGSKTQKEKDDSEFSRRAISGLPVDMGGPNGMPRIPGSAAPEPVDLQKISDDYNIGQRGHFQLSNALAKKVAQDRVEGKVLQ